MELCWDIGNQVMEEANELENLRLHIVGVKERL